MLREETGCLTGHRPKGLPWMYDESSKGCKRFKTDLRKQFIEVIDEGAKNFLTGMAEGFDMIGAEIIINLKKKYKDIKLIAVVPCKNQYMEWSTSQQARYKKILKKCDEIIILNEEYTDTCMRERNEYMVKNSSVVIACFNGKRSGTSMTINFAKKHNCKIHIINPNDYKEE